MASCPPARRRFHTGGRRGGRHGGTKGGFPLQDRKTIRPAPAGDTPLVATPHDSDVMPSARNVASSCHPAGNLGAKLLVFWVSGPGGTMVAKPKWRNGGRGCDPDRHFVLHLRADRTLLMEPGRSFCPVVPITLRFRSPSPASLNSSGLDLGFASLRLRAPAECLGLPASRVPAALCPAPRARPLLPSRFSSLPYVPAFLPLLPFDLPSLRLASFLHFAPRTLSTRSRWEGSNHFPAVRQRLCLPQCPGPSPGEARSLVGRSFFRQLRRDRTAC